MYIQGSWITPGYKLQSRALMSSIAITIDAFPIVPFLLSYNCVERFDLVADNSTIVWPYKDRKTLFCPYKDKISWYFGLFMFEQETRFLFMKWYLSRFSLVDIGIMENGTGRFDEGDSPR